MFKIISVVGARPQFIKMATLSRAFQKHGQAEHLIIHTGQHYDAGMSEVFFQEMLIPEPAYNLGINSLNHGAMTGRMLEEIEKICLKEEPDALIVYGDTNSTLAGALAGKKLHIPIAHVEAGLRSFNMQMPEEINRILTDRISDFLYYPSEIALENLKAEGFENFPCELVFSGDVMLDALKFYSQVSEEKAAISDLVNPGEEFILCTLHRQENTDDPERLAALVAAINKLVDEVPVILPLHPRTLKKLEEQNLKLKAKLTPPLSYFNMLELLKACKLVMTDSGGLQKEAYFLNKYCITLRDETEWKELVEMGVNQLVGANKDLILNVYYKLSGKGSIESKNVYGDGNAAEKIVRHLLGVL